MPHIRVVQGQSVNNIAFEAGFAWENVWMLDENAELRKLRGDGGVLRPGDELYLPEREDKIEDRGSEAKHAFKLPDIPFRIAVTLRRPDTSPVEGVEWDCELDGEVVKSGKTGSDGRIEVTVPPATRSAELILGGRRVPLKLRHLDPANTPRGMRQRLRNLGYETERGPGPLGPKDYEALRRFQADQELEQSSAPDAETLKRLRSFHEAVDLDGDPNKAQGEDVESARAKVVGDDTADDGPVVEAGGEDSDADDPTDAQPFERAEEAAIGSDASRPMSTHCLQSILSSLEFKPGRIDGIEGPRTRLAIRRFQSAHRDRHGLTVSGKADGPTLAALRKELADG